MALGDSDFRRILDPAAGEKLRREKMEAFGNSSNECNGPQRKLENFFPPTLPQRGCPSEMSAIYLVVGTIPVEPASLDLSRQSVFAKPCRPL